jgi:hypothetical protein
VTTYLDNFRLLPLIAGCEIDLPGLTGDDLDGAHEDIGDDGDAEEAVEEAEDVERGPDADPPAVLLEERQQQTRRTLVQAQHLHRIALVQAGHLFSMRTEMRKFCKTMC